MRNRVLSVMKKELNRFFGDKRLVMTSLIMPGLLIYVLYSFMGTAITGMISNPAGALSPAYAVGMPPSVESAVSKPSVKALEAAGRSDIEKIKAQIGTKGALLLVVFPEGFEEGISSYSPASGIPAPNIEMYYNSSDLASQGLYSSYVSLLNAFEESRSNLFDINRGLSPDLATERDTTGFAYSMLMPLLLTMMLFSSSMALAPESIAGEKERGTIATLLVTPIKRGELALGKIFSLALLSLLCGMASMLGVLLSLPKLMQLSSQSLAALSFTASDYLMLAMVVSTTALLFASAMSIISAFAKSIKEAQTAITPLLFVVVVAGITSMLGGGQASPALCLIPVYGSVQCISAIFSFSASAANLASAILANIAYSVACAFALTKMFNSEKVIFAR